MRLNLFSLLFITLELNHIMVVVSILVFLLIAILFLILFFHSTIKKRNQKILILSKEHEQVKLKSETAIEKLKNTEENEHQLANELNNKQTELINFALNIIQKNTFLEELRLKVNEIKAGTKDIESLIKLNELSNDINRHIALDKNRKTFQLQLEEANRDFYIRMNQKYPTLTEKEKRLAAYMRLNFSTKDIASILNITTKSVEINRYRLRKKLGIEQGINLYEFILSI